MNQLGIRIKIRREKKGLSQSKLAGLIGVDSTLICKIEKGEATGSVFTLYKIAQILDTTIDALLKDAA